MKAAASCLLVALSCAKPLPQRQFIADVDASVLNGFWAAEQGADDAGRPLGIVVFDLPEGPGWSPHGLLIEKSVVYLTHDCRDFRLEGPAGIVRPVRGIKPIGHVRYHSDAGAAAGLEWNTATPDWELALGLGYRGPGTLVSLSFDGGVAAGDGGTLELSYALRYQISEPTGTVAPDGGLMLEEIVAHTVQLRRELRCP